MFFSTVIYACKSDSISKIPIVINTWGFSNATIQAWKVLQDPDKTAVSENQS